MTTPISSRETLQSYTLGDPDKVDGKWASILIQQNVYNYIYESQAWWNQIIT